MFFTPPASRDSLFRRPCPLVPEIQLPLHISGSRGGRRISSLCCRTMCNDRTFAPHYVRPSKRREDSVGILGAIPAASRKVLFYLVKKKGLNGNKLAISSLRGKCLAWLFFQRIPEVYLQSLLSDLYAVEIQLPLPHLKLPWRSTDILSLLQYNW